MSQVWSQTLGMATVAYMVVKRFIHDGTSDERRAFWGDENTGNLGEPNYVNPVPYSWMGPYSSWKSNRLFIIIRDLVYRMMFGPKQDGSFQYSIWCRNKSTTGSSTWKRIRFNWNYFYTELQNVNLTDEPNDQFAMHPEWGDQGHPLEWRDRLRPCYHHRLLMHEILHWMGYGMGDWQFQFRQCEDTDQGPCDPFLGHWALKTTYGGWAAQFLASVESSPDAWKLGTARPYKNCDNYAFLIRNLALHWAVEVMGIDRFPNPGWETYYSEIRDACPFPHIKCHIQQW